MVANDSIKLYMLSPQYQKDIKNQSLFNKGSTYFFRKQFPVSEKLISEIDIHIMKKAKVLPGPQVFAIRTFIFEKFFWIQSITRSNLFATCNKWTNWKGIRWNQKRSWTRGWWTNTAARGRSRLKSTRESNCEIKWWRWRWSTPNPTNEKNSKYKWWWGW